MELDELKNKVDSLKRTKENGHGNLRTKKELLLLWDFVQSIADNGIEEHKKLADYLITSGIKSVGPNALIDDRFCRKLFSSFAEFENAVNSEAPFKL